MYCKVRITTWIYYIDFADADDKYLLINNRNGQINIENGVVTGYQEVSNAVTTNTTNVYLYIETEQEAIESCILANGVITEEKAAEGNHKCAVLKFSNDTKQLKLRYGISFISIDQAKANLKREIADYNNQ